QSSPRPWTGSEALLNIITICTSGKGEGEQGCSSPFVIEYIPAEAAVGFTEIDAPPAPLVIDIPDREPYSDDKVPWTYEEGVGSLEQQFGVMGITRLGRLYENPATTDKGKALATEEETRPRTLPTPSKKVTEEEAETFMKVIKASEYKVVEQMAKSPAHILLLALLLNSEPHREALMRVLTAAQVPKGTPPDRIEETINSIFSNTISFSDDELPPEGCAHFRALHIMNVDLNRIRPSKTAIRAFDGSRRETVSVIRDYGKIGPSRADRMIGKVLLRHNYISGTSLGARGQGINRSIEVEEYKHRRGLSFRPSCHENIEARRSNRLHRLATHYGILQVDDEGEKSGWKMYFDGAVNSMGSGIGAVLISPDAHYYPVAAKIDFSCTNNVAEYEACILGLQAAIDFRVKELEVFGDSMLTIFQTLGQWKAKDAKLVPYHEYLEKLTENFEDISFTYTPRMTNQLTDALATLASMVSIMKENLIETLKIEIAEGPAHCNSIEASAAKPWYEDIKNLLRTGQYPLFADRRDQKTLRRLTIHYFLSGEILYRCSFDSTLLRVRHRDFNPGDLVLRKVLHVTPDSRGKFSYKYDSPFVVKEVFSGGAVVLSDMDGTENTFPVNADAIKKYYPSKTSSRRPRQKRGSEWRDLKSRKGGSWQKESTSHFLVRSKTSLRRPRQKLEDPRGAVPPIHGGS
ncbi:hypothetical protein CRG98_038100, partial [Punica granatum]